MTAPGDAAERFGAEYFEEVYRDYPRQNPARKLRFYASVIRRLAPAGAERTLLEVGCGLGAFLASFQDPGWTLFGSDLSPFAVQTVRERQRQITVHQASAAEQVLPDASVDVVAAFDVIEHVPERDAVRTAVGRMLVPGGLFVFVVPVYDGPTGPIIRRLDRDETHVHTHGRQEWIDWVATGFDVVAWWGILRYLLPGGYYLHLPTRRLRRATPAILVAARKA